MVVNQIHYSKRFIKLFKKLPQQVKERAVKTEQLFKENPFHPSLRLHKLQGSLEGLWSISITMNYRIVFEPKENGDMLFISIGTHSIYDK